MLKDYFSKSLPCSFYVYKRAGKKPVILDAYKEDVSGRSRVKSMKLLSTANGISIYGSGRGKPNIILNDSEFKGTVIVLGDGKWLGFEEAGNVRELLESVSCS